MHLVLAGLGAIVVGAGDFSGGTASRRDLPHPVAALSFLVGALVLLALSPFFGGTANASDLGWGAVSGIGGAVGTFTLYRGLASAPMGLVSPIAGLVAASVPVVGGLALGEELTTTVALGLSLGLVAIVLVSATPAAGLSRQERVAGVSHGVVTGLGFGVQLLALALVGANAGLNPVVISRVVSFCLVGGYLLISKHRVMPTRQARPISMLAGLLTGVGVLLYYLAVGVGPIVVSTAIYALFPVSTVVMARFIHHEKLNGRQLSGVALALGAAMLMAATSVG